MALAKRGFGGNLVKKVEEFRDTLKDVMEELKEWGEETADDEDEDEDDDEEVKQITKEMASAQISDAQAMLDDFMDSQQYIPRDDPELIRDLSKEGYYLVETSSDIRHVVITLGDLRREMW